MLDVPSLPPVPGPPHDPTFWLLDARTGWREAFRSGVEPGPRGGLTLARRPDAWRSLTEASGSLGGVVPPRAVAVADDGVIVLVDPRSGAVRVFDPCACGFWTIPGIGGRGTGAREFGEPAGLAVGAGMLAVADPGARRVSLFALPGYALRGHLAPPADEAAGWQPVDVAIDAHGTVWTADPGNGAIQAFDRAGRRTRRIGGLGAVRRIVVDDDGCLAVLIDGEASVRTYDRTGEPMDVVTDLDELVRRFPVLPFTVDRDGHLDLTDRCLAVPHDASCLCATSRATPPARRVFDAGGRPVTVPAVAGPEPRYVGSGTWIAGPLDSAIHRCQWHRIVLTGTFGRAPGIVVSTLTGDTPYAFDPGFDEEERWTTRQRVDAGDGTWDCLVQSGPGRYLWLRLEMSSDGITSPCVDGIRVEYPRVSLRRYLPAVYGAEPISADFTDRFLALFDTTFRGIEERIDRLPALFDPRSAPSTATGDGPDFLSWLATWVGVSLDRAWPEDRRRRWLRAAVRLYPLRGTVEGLRRALLVFLGLDLDSLECGRDRCVAAQHCLCPERPTTGDAWRPPLLILEHFRLRRWLYVGQGRLGDQAVLWGRQIVGRSELDVNARTGETRLIGTPDPYHDPIGVTAHRFTVFIPQRFAASDAQRRSLETLIATERPGHTLARIEYVAPRFRIGRQSMLGYDAVIGRYEAGVTLDGTRLGEPTVLTGPGTTTDLPALVVGKQARIGATTRLT